MANVWRHLHPMCISPDALFKTILENYVAGTIPSASTLLDHCNKVINGDLPMDYHECQNALTSEIRTQGPPGNSNQGPRQH